MQYSIAIILVALLQYLFFSLRVGLARPKYGVEAPKCTGHETWERIYRVQQNTLEQLIVFIPGLLTFTFFVSPRWSILLGVGFILARQYYSYAYVKNPKRRAFPPTFIINMILVVGSLVGMVVQAYRASMIL